VTYPETTVAETVGRLTVPVQLDNSSESSAPLVKRFRHVWTPDLRVLDGDGEELYRWNGYLPPFEFAAQLLAAVAHARLRLREYETAAALYAETVKRFPTSLVAPEAQYFTAVANYRKTGESHELLRGWHQLETTYPGSAWTVKQDFN
jgi:hypothetical protein